MKHWLRLWTWLIASSALAWVFSLYLQPGFAQSMADQLWMCF
jgi:hypothetical protein